jgi:hypothetical protein
MATTKVTGRTEDEIEEMLAAHREREHPIPFEKRFCLAKIPRQPDDYDGPKRYCVSTNVLSPIYTCKFHGGAGQINADNLDPLANMKHGMKATRESILKDMHSEGNEWQLDLYEWITQEWPEAYDINVEDDPQAEYEFHALATEIVRAERAEGYILREGENGKKRVFSPNGEMYFDDIPHYLSDMIQRQRKLIMKMEDNLGISRKKRMQNEQARDATDIMKSFAEVGASLISDTEQEYNPDEWEPDGGAGDAS